MISSRCCSLLTGSFTHGQRRNGMMGRKDHSLSCAIVARRLRSSSRNLPKIPPNKSAKDVDDRPMTAMERMRYFPTAVKALYKDYGLYRTINDAAQTARNSWKGRIPRQQAEQQRHFTESIGIVGPLVMLWIPPIIGYIPMVLAIAAPRQVLSRHFQNVYELSEFSNIAHRQRVSYWKKFQDIVWNSIEDTQATRNLMSGTTSDAAGVVITDREIVRRLCDSIRLPPLRERQHLVPLALSVGVYSIFPKFLSDLFIPLSPSMHLRRQLVYWGESIAKDDQALIQEPGVLSHLSRVELTEACFRRALPAEGLEDSDLRKMLQNHLELATLMPATLENKGLWLLMWNILRQSG